MVNSRSLPMQMSNYLQRCKQLLSVCVVFFLTPLETTATTVLSLSDWGFYQMEGKPSLRGAAIIGDSLWVTGTNNAVFVSQDGGKTWLNKSVNSSIKTDFRDIELFNSSSAIVMGVGTGAKSALFKTIDGGNSWHLLYQNKDVQGFFDSIGFWNENEGLLLGDPVDGYYVVKKTSDGGKTWRRIAKANLPSMGDKEAAFAASGNTLIVGEEGKAWITTGGFSASVYVSNDYGENWQRQSVPLYSDTQTAGGYGLALNHKQQLFVLGGDYKQRPAKYSNIATYVNGQWQKVNAGERGLRTAMSCQQRLCLATGKTSTDMSFNDGQHWVTLYPHKSHLAQEGFYTVASDNMVFLAAGPEGKVAVLPFKDKRQNQSRIKVN